MRFKVLFSFHSNPAVISITKIKPGFGPIWMGNLTCTGDEVDIALCKFSGWGHTGNCTHTQDIAMTCGKKIVILKISITFFQISIVYSVKIPHILIIRGYFVLFFAFT